MLTESNSNIAEAGVSGGYYGVNVSTAVKVENANDEMNGQENDKKEETL